MPDPKDSLLITLGLMPVPDSIRKDKPYFTPITEITKTCPTCNTEFHRKPHRSNRQWAEIKYCSISCSRYKDGSNPGRNLFKGKAVTLTLEQRSRLNKDIQMLLDHGYTSVAKIYNRLEQLKRLPANGTKLISIQVIYRMTRKLRRKDNPKPVKLI